MSALPNEDLAFCVSAYDDLATYQARGPSRDSNFKTEGQAREAFDRLKAGRKFYAVAYGYKGATGDFIDYDEWTKDDED